ncbi:uncharacterized protein LOC132634891 [Lycium barbarum]|uniref:uncharacterized protein LOC132634891 n=1 Tax=Lycium barbarum TaxID=112863 RepID=UPI00293E3312|nr:uncharacterized protein LOC132634891 [Lycium barbarum]
MTEKNFDSVIPPGFATSLTKTVSRSISPTSSETQNSTITHQSEKCMDDFVRRGLDRPWKQETSVSPDALSMTTKETPAVPLPPMPPSGSSINAPLLIVDEEQRDTKINLNPLSILSPPPNPRLRINECSPHINEKSKTMISHVKSVLEFQLTSGSMKNVEAMVKCANNAFSTLDFLEADYTSFYNDVREFIAYHYDYLLIAKRQREMQSFPAELKTRYEDAKICANNLKDEIVQTQGHILMVVKKKESFERQIVDAMELIGKLKEGVAVFEQEEEALKQEKRKCIVAHEIAHHEVQKLCTQVKAAKNVLQKIDERKNAALNGIESSTKRLKSHQS